MFNYLISISKTEDATVGTIHDSNSKLKVKAFDLLNSVFIPSEGEVSFFVTSGKETIAFETRGYKKQHEVLILQMISWYCIYLGLLEAQIHATWPQLSEAI
jgi:hypothetical protein